MYLKVCKLKVKGAAAYILRCDFRCLANVSSHKVNSRTESRILFQTCGAAAANERSPREYVSLLIVQFAITINSNVCPHIRVLNTLMRNPMRDVIGIRYFRSTLGICTA